MRLPVDLSNFKDLIENKIPQQKQYLQELLSNEYLVDIVVKELTIQNKSKQEGRIPKDFILNEQPYRSFASERTRQILRQVSTQLFFSLKPIITNLGCHLEEIQIMYFECNGNSNLIIAANPHNVSTYFSSIFNTEMEEVGLTFKKFLISKHNIKDKEGLARNQRYSNKLFQAMYKSNNLDSNTDNRDIIRKEKIAHILNNCEIRMFNLDLTKIADFSSGSLLKNAISNSNNGIFFLVVQNAPNKLKLRHAEEFLVDLAEQLRLTFSDKQELYTCIAGKKRPCTGCLGRMKGGEITEFNPRNGRFWLHSIQNQNEKTRAHTIELLFNKNIYISKNKSGKTIKTGNSYDTGSDSDGPEYPSKFLINQLIYNAPIIKAIQNEYLNMTFKVKISYKKPSLTI